MGNGQSHGNHGSRSGGMSPNNMPPLLFNSVHGENVTISENASMAKRTNSFCKAIVFSNRAVKVAEKVCIKFTEVSTNWSGVLRFGFTSHDPSLLKSSGLPRYACPDLTSKPGYWAKAFSDFYVKKDSILFYYVNSAGDVHFGINGEEKDLFFSGVDTRGPLWAMIDIYGNTTCIEFVDPRAHLNNSRRSINESASSREDAEISLSAILPSLNALQLEEPVDTSKSDNRCFMDGELQSLSFHRIRGKNVISLAESTPNLALRRTGEYSNAYVFTERPILPGETIVIQVLQSDSAFHPGTSMAFGLTSCNPGFVHPEFLPEDSHLLIDRPEYWVVKKDVANNPSSRDILAFSMSLSGAVTMTKNNGAPIVLMHVDHSVPLWAFFDLYGTTEKIRMLGSIKRSEPLYSTCGERSRRDTSMYSTKSQSRLPPSHSLSTRNTTTENRAEDYFELSHSPNSMEASDRQAYACGQTASGSQLATSDASKKSFFEKVGWSFECVACCERTVDSVFYSCGHMCMCYSCAMEYWKSKEKGCCPICRAAISDVIRCYKS